uniref:Kinesin family member 26B n=1 Tax=Scleropages formosus TaxID=113540 RepID=A0A8C9SWA4_SCLFO
MTSLTGNKERSSATARSRKYAIIDDSPTKSASYSPEMWYRKTCEESRSGTRPAPEGAGSIPGSSGTPSPGSGISSPGSFTGSPGTTSPGVCTGSPGSLGGSPGFGTGSPGSGSGSSPGSDRGVWCENCNARLIELKRQALKLLIPGPFSSKDPSFPALLNDKLQVPNSARKAWNERDGRCDVCATHLSQLKQEAVYMVLSLEQAACPEGSEHSPSSPQPLASLPSLVGSRNILQGVPRDRAQPSAAYPSPSCGGPGPAPAGFSKHGPKPSSLGVGSGVERRVGKTGAQIPPQQPTVPSNVLSSVALQAHQYLESTWSMSRANGVTLYPCQISQLVAEGGSDGLTEATLNRYNADHPVPHSSPAQNAPPVIAAPSSGTSAAASFFARAAQKLNLSSKKKKPRTTPSPACDPPSFPTNFSGILQTSPPPAPPCLLRAVNKVKDTPGLGKVKVMLRVCPILSSDTSESRSFLKVDSRKKQVTIMDPAANLGQGAQQKRAGGSQSSPKIFAFDATFSHEASQAEVCAGTVAEVIQSVVNGADGCVFCFGHAKLGKSYTMIGKDDSTQSLGIIPCTISWLFKLIHERKEKTGARFSVRVSAVEVSGRDEVLTDLLSEVATGSLQDGQSPGVYLCEDPICGMQLQNQSELRAPTPEKAAYFLDAAIAARSSSRPSCGEEERRNSHMLFTLHVYQYRMDKASKGGMSGGRSRLHLIDLGSCVKVLSKTRDVSGGLCLSLSALGNVILALVNGSKHIPYKDSKLTMLLRESLGNMNCRTTMIAHISASPSNFSETLSTIQIASRVLRMKKKKAKQYTSSSSGGESSCEEGRIRRPTQLRTLHFQNVVDSELPLLHLSSDHDDYSSSEHSCDTVIYVGPDGTALSDKELTDNEGPPEVVPIVPSLQKNRNEKGGTEDSQTGKPEQDCLKCNTFAELQERLECIDGSEEVSRFPFEEVPATKSPKGDLSSTQSQTIRYGQEKHQAKKHLHNQQQDNIQEVTVEAEMTQCIIQSFTQSSPGNSELSSNRCVPGGSNSILPIDPLQKTQTLNENKESLSTVNHSESKVRNMGSPRLGIASLTKTSEYKPPSSPSQRCKVYTQKGILPSMSSASSLSSTGKSSTESLLQPEARISPVGMGPQVIKKSTSSSSMGSSDMQSENPVQPALENKVEVQTSTTLTVQQPLELNGEDELVFTLVKELSISGLVENGRPTSIISFNSDCSVQALASGSRPVSIISSISEDLDGFPITSSSTTTATSAVSITTFLPLSKVHNTLSPSQHSSINSWLRDLDSSHNKEQPCTNFTVQPCCNQRKNQVEPLKYNLPEVQIDTEGKTSETDGHTAKVNEKSEVSKEIPHFGKATVTISSVQNLANSKDLVPIKAIITVNPCDVLKTAVKHDSAEMSQCMKTTQIQDLKTPPVSISSKIKFEDPWMKREKEESKFKENVCVVKPEIKTSCSETNKRQIESCVPEKKGFLGDSLKRVVDGCEIVLNTPDSLTPVCKEDILRTASLPRGWHRLNRQDEPEEPSSHYFYGEYNSLGVTTSTPCSPRATLERKGLSAKQSIFARTKGIPPLPPVRRSSLDQRNRVNLQFGTGNTSTLNQTLTFIRSPADDVGNNGKLKSTNVESSKLFSAKLEQLANRTSSLGRSHAAGNYDCFSLERADSLMSVGSRSSTGRDCTMPRVGRSLRRSSVSSPPNASPGNNTPQSPKASPSKISAVSKLLMANPKARSLSASSTKTLSFSTKSLPQSVNRSSSLPPNGKNQNQGSWSTQSLSRSRGSGLASKLPLKAVNGRISELLQGGSSRGGHGRRNSGVDDGGVLQGEERQATQTLPSPYSKITPPRRPHRCSSGHASDNSSVLSGELPPAMGKTALFYHSGGSSGYESMLRDSEATGSTSSAQDSTSDNSSSVSGHRSVKNQKKKNNTGSQRRRLIPALSVDTASPVRKPVISPGVRWVDGPLRPSQRGLSDTFEIKVYEIDDVERLQRRRGVANKEMVLFSAKLKILEHRQQRISVVRAKYDWLKKELEQTKQHLMIAPEKWTNEFDLQQTFEVDSLEYLEALEFVTGRLENRVNFYKAHLMMITCFDVTSRRR